MRPSLDEYFLGFAYLSSTRSTCLRRKVGAVIVKDKQIIATGYNGAPAGCTHCEDVGCLRESVQAGEKLEHCRATHAEQNAIVQAAKFGISTADTAIYITHQPCTTCAKLIINAGIKTVKYKASYPDQLSLDLLKEAGIKVTQL